MSQPGAKQYPCGSTCGQADDGILPRRQQSQGQGQGQFQIAAEAHLMLSGHIPDKGQVELFVNGKPVGADRGHRFHDLGGVTANEKALRLGPRHGSP